MLKHWQSPQAFILHFQDEVKAIGPAGIFKAVQPIKVLIFKSFFLLHFFDQKLSVLIVTEGGMLDSYMHRMRHPTLLVTGP
jgi:hypothetical protein